MKEAERTYVMKENFMALHQEGLTIKEIADKYNLSAATVYLHLQEIADKNGVTRQSLLQVVRVPSERQFREEEVRMRANFEELKLEFAEARKKLSNIEAIIDRVIQEENNL